MSCSGDAGTPSRPQELRSAAELTSPPLGHPRPIQAKPPRHCLRLDPRSSPTEGIGSKHRGTGDRPFLFQLRLPGFIADSSFPDQGPEIIAAVALLILTAAGVFLRSPPPFKRRQPLRTFW